MTILDKSGFSLPGRPLRFAFDWSASAHILSAMVNQSAVTLIEIFMLALALAADAFTVGATVGLHHRAPRQLFRLSYHFGLFQSIMSFGGIVAGTVLVRFISKWDHWVVFILLGAIGARMIWNAFRGKEDDNDKDPTKGLTMIALSTAVSIDAFAAGVGLGAAHAPVALTVLIIGVVAAVSTLVAMLSAGKVQAWIGKRSEIAAGIVLIFIGLKTLYEHIVG